MLCIVLFGTAPSHDAGLLSLRHYRALTKALNKDTKCVRRLSRCLISPTYQTKSVPVRHAPRDINQQDLARRTSPRCPINTRSVTSGEDINAHVFGEMYRSLETCFYRKVINKAEIQHVITATNFPPLFCCFFYRKRCKLCPEYV